jgi:hypothetical protein
VTVYALTDNDGRLVSLGTIIADPLPDGLSARLLTDDEQARQKAGGRWEAGTFTDPPPPEPDPAEVRIAALEAQVAALLDALTGGA